MVPMRVPAVFPGAPAARDRFLLRGRGDGSRRSGRLDCSRIADRVAEYPRSGEDMTETVRDPIHGMIRLMPEEWEAVNAGVTSVCAGFGN
jgi:hypothetical protein